MNENFQNSSAALNATIAGAVLAGGALLASSPSAQAVSPALTYSDAIFGRYDTKALNYALALEALEADLYAQALLRLTTGGTNALGKTIVGLNLSENDLAVRYVRDFGKIEVAHRDYFIGILGSDAITASGKPFANVKFDFGFDKTTATDSVVLGLIQTAELTGTRAYIGAVMSFTTPKYLQAIAAIQGTEARHTAIITAIINQRFGGSAPVAPLANKDLGIDTDAAQADVLNAISKYIVL